MPGKSASSVRKGCGSEDPCSPRQAEKEGREEPYYPSGSVDPTVRYQPTSPKATPLITKLEPELNSPRKLWLFKKTQTHHPSNRIYFDALKNKKKSHPKIDLVVQPTPATHPATPLRPAVSATWFRRLERTFRRTWPQSAAGGRQADQAWAGQVDFEQNFNCLIHCFGSDTWYFFELSSSQIHQKALEDA